MPFAQGRGRRRRWLAFTSQRLTFEPGQNVFCRGDVGDAAYIIIGGEAEVLVDQEGTEVKVATVGKNELIGEIAILCDVPRTATVRAKSHVTALKIPKDLFFTMVAEFPQMAVEVMCELARRLNRTTVQLSDALAKGQ